MALITCPECGREISDKAVACPGCGCPMEKFCHTTIECEQARIEISSDYLTIFNSRGKNIVSDKMDNFLLLFSEMVSGAYVLIFSHGSLKGSYGCRVKNQYIDKAMELSNEFSMRGKKISGLTYWKAFKFKNDTQLLRKQQEKMEMQDNLQKISAMGDILSGKGKTSCCPKCRSTQITYGGNRISLGRAVVGGAVAGPAGATLGGLTGKKGYAVCLNCGKRWKI